MDARVLSLSQAALIAAASAVKPATVKIKLSQHIGAPCAVKVGVGDKVVKGEAIGTFSNRKGEKNKKSDKRFLHFEIWHRGKPLDPNTYIAF